MDIEKLKLKMSSQLLPEEKTFIKENIDKLSDEDKAAYADFLEEAPELSVTKTAEGGEGEGGEGKTGEGEGAGAGGEGEGQKQTPAPFQFNSEQEAIEFVHKIQEDDAKAKQAALDAAKTPAEKRYVEENWKPKTWNEAMKLAVQFAKQEIAEEGEKQTAKETEDAKKLESEWQAISKEHKIPSLTTQEGRVIHDQIVRVALAHGKQTFQEAYDLWSIIPKEKGGGYEIPASDAGAALAAQKKTQVSAQKKVAAKIGGQNPGTSQKTAGEITPPSYDELHKAKSTFALMKKAGVLHG